MVICIILVGIPNVYALDTPDDTNKCDVTDIDLRVKKVIENHIALNNSEINISQIKSALDFDGNEYKIVE